jgi:hypothetical protein
MGYAIFAFALVFFLIVGNVQIHTSSQTDQSSSVSADHLATDMLRLAGAVNDWRYSRTLSDGPLTVSQFGMVPVPDSRISAAISGGRLWIWSAGTPGLAASLATQSDDSALACTVSGGRLKMSDGTDMNLLLPAGVAEGNVVYLN